MHAANRVTPDSAQLQRNTHCSQKCVLHSYTHYRAQTLWEECIMITVWLSAFIDAILKKCKRISYAGIIGINIYTCENSRH